MDLAINILVGLFVFVALLMMLVILMQRPRSEGLGAAFGGGVTENIFGAQTTNVLTKFTGWLAAIFFLLTFVLSILYARQGNMQSNLHGEIIKSQTPAPSASATPIAPATSPGASPGPSSAVSPAATVTNTVPATTSPASSAPPATSASAPANTPAVAPKPSVAPSVSASPKR
jgi:preprotein translocase subunit SecG